MKKENVSILLIVLMFIVVGFALSMGWLAIENQNVSFNNLKAKQYNIVKETNSLKDSLRGMDQRIKDVTNDFKSLKLAVNNGKITERELTSRINTMNDELAKWQAISERIMSKIEDLDNKVKLSNKVVKNIDLGKVSVEKDIAQNTQEKSTE
ncbi:MAG: hypothetical protein B1H08_04265 [Candidatus Omnitrophica bacterium 4484_171]|nr:MAG: hypothetical protein B1H08_04265 [Candidatus Omnitrophica bacterium 4484_171]